MNKKHIIIAAFAISAIGLTAALSPVAAAPANMIQHIEVESENATVLKIAKRKRRRGRKRGRYYNFGIATSVATTCNYYYHKAVTTGLRYWWVKFNHTCQQ